MKLKFMALKNIRCYNSIELSFSEKVNIFVGPNNAGKSTLLKSIFSFQSPHILNKEFVRLGEESASINYRFNSDEEDEFHRLIGKFTVDYENYLLSYNVSQPYFNNEYNLINGGAYYGDNFKQNYSKYIESINLYPNFQMIQYLSHRLTSYQNSNIGSKYNNTITEFHNNLVSHLDSMDIHGEQYGEFIEIVERIFKRKIVTKVENEGKSISLRLGDNKYIISDNLGDGVLHLVGLIYYLVKFTRKIFIIEELENFIHPKALKILLDFISSKSISNQFFIATHSQIVANYFYNNDNCIFNTEQVYENDIPTTSISKIEDNSSLFRCFNELGNCLSDFNIHEGWIILEESTAETIINELLIPWFCSGLIGKVRTISSRGNSNVPEYAHALETMFLYTHLSPIYKGKSWVIIDGDEPGKELREKFIEKYTGRISSIWSEENFILLNESDFEHYYPPKFADKIEEIQVIENKTRLNSKEKSKQKQPIKKQLVNEIKKWKEEDEQGAKQEFKESAKHVIDLLKKIEKEIVL